MRLPGGCWNLFSCNTVSTDPSASVIGVFADAGAIASAIEATRYRPSELEAIARLLLRDRLVRLVPGEWWAYSLDSGILVYPAHLLREWTGTRAIGALCHEVAEACYAGPDAANAMGRFTVEAARFGIESGSATLFLNVANDFRVNSFYLRDYPGSSTFIRSLYEVGTELHPKTDVRGRRRSAEPLTHHRFLDGLIGHWVHATWPALDRPAHALARDAVDKVWPTVQHAATATTLIECAERLIPALQVYGELIARSREEMEREKRAAIDEPPDRELEEPTPQTPDPDRNTQDEQGTDSSEADEELDQSGVFFFVRDDAPIGQMLPENKDDEEDVARPKPPPNGRPAELPPRDGFDSGPRWASGAIQRIRRFMPKGGIDYDQFDYIAKVRDLEPLIDACVNGRGDSPGLAQILMLRRFGTSDPFRRPRRFRRGDTGDLDEDRPENLLLDPSIAFLRGVRQQRQDSLKDFANAILLDISGSVVQRGYPSRKFDQVVETGVLFIEIHERLKLPYEIVAFSDAPHVMRSFEEIAFDSMRVDPSSSYIVKDFSYIFREMYRLDHGETQEARAIERAVGDINVQPGLKTILMVTDGISSDRPALVDALVAIEERNQIRAGRERLGLLAFGVGLAEGEFKSSYEPVIDDARINCARGTLVPKIDALPDIICQAIEQRILRESFD